MLVYKTKEQSDIEKLNYYWDEYHLVKNSVNKFKCHKFYISNGNKGEWQEEKELEIEWDINDPNIPEWLSDYIE